MRRETLYMTNKHISIKLWYDDVIPSSGTRKYDHIDNVVNYRFTGPQLCIETAGNFPANYTFQMSHLVRISIINTDIEGDWDNDKSVPVVLSVFNRSRTMVKPVYRYYRAMIRAKDDSLGDHIGFAEKHSDGYVIDVYHPNYLLSAITRRDRPLGISYLSSDHTRRGAVWRC